ncbi:MAG: MaoC family dehydratase [Novosphingobium sp.]
MSSQSASDAFDPTAHHLTSQRWFEDYRLGELFRLPSRTIGDGNFAAFQAVSLDNHPIHYDYEYCRALGHKAPLAHGLQVLAFTAAGAGLFPHMAGPGLIGMIEVQARMLLPVYPGDTLYPALEIVGLTPQSTTGIIEMRATVHNQDRKLVLDGMHRYLMKLASAAKQA